MIAGLARGGTLANLGRIQFRWPWVIVVAVLVRLAMSIPPVARIDASRYVYALALAAIVAWTIWQIKRVRGVWLVSLGAALNLVVIVANSMRMPVAPAVAGSLLRHGQLGQYIVMGPGTNLNALGDWIRLFPSPEVYSVGDLIIALGLAVLVFYSELTPP